MRDGNKGSLDPKKDKDLVREIKQDIIGKAFYKANQASIPDEPKLKRPNKTSSGSKGG